MQKELNLRRTAKYYTKTPNGKYRVQKIINGKSRGFGVYDTEEEAKSIVEELKRNGFKNNFKVIEPNPRNFCDEDVEIINTASLERNLKPRSRQTFYEAVHQFNKYTNRDFYKSLMIYESEEDDLPWKKRTIKKELLGYRSYLSENFLHSTVKVYFGRLLTLLRHLDVELVDLPPLSKKNTNDLEPITYNDLLTHEELSQILSVSDSFMKAYVSFAASSGCARMESLSLTIEDYLEANNMLITPYVSIIDLIELVDTNIVPTFKIKRHKTNKYYFTYCTPQANQYIKEYLLGRSDVNKFHLSTPLFKRNLDAFNHGFKMINEDLCLGKCRKYNRFRSHMLRKYNASTLYNNGMHMEDVDSLQGRGKDSTHSAYFMEDPNKLKEKYVQYIDVLTI